MPVACRAVSDAGSGGLSARDGMAFPSFTTCVY